jgi:hypothetical protein
MRKNTTTTTTMMINIDFNSETIQLIAWLIMVSSVSVATVISIAYAVGKYWDRKVRKQ